MLKSLQRIGGICGDERKTGRLQAGTFSRHSGLDRLDADLEHPVLVACTLANKGMLVPDSCYLFQLKHYFLRAGFAFDFF